VVVYRVNVSASSGAGSHGFPQIKRHKMVVVEVSNFFHLRVFSTNCAIFPTILQNFSFSSSIFSKRAKYATNKYSTFE